jgi:hypothetical protein
MPITTKDAVLKRLYEENGQQTMFGYDNLQFKTVNHPNKHKFVNICQNFKLKKIQKLKRASTIWKQALFKY